MKELIKTLVDELKKRVLVEVPQNGDFETVEVRRANTDKKLCVNTYALEFMQPPTGVKNRNTIRGLKLVGYKGEVGMEILMESGTTDVILDKLDDEQFIDDLIKCAFKLDDSLLDL